jgi:hypothetical protein
MKKIGCIATLSLVLLSNALFANVDKIPYKGNTAASDSAHLKKIVKIPLQATVTGKTTPGAVKTGIPGPNGQPRKVSTYQDLKKTPPVKDTTKKIGH